jgi:glycerol-3-phosphate dehydrogenase (NAD+)
VYERFIAGISEEDRVATHESWDKIMRWGQRRNYQKSCGPDVLAKTEKVAIMGGGSFGTAMATLLARNKATLDVCILVRSEADATAINEQRVNRKYLPDHELPPSVRATTDPAVALPDADFIVHAVPVQSSRAFLETVRDFEGPRGGFVRDDVGGDSRGSRPRSAAGGAERADVRGGDHAGPAHRDRRRERG